MLWLLGSLKCASQIARYQQSWVVDRPYVLLTEAARKSDRMFALSSSCDIRHRADATQVENARGRWTHAKSLVGEGVSAGGNPSEQLVVGRGKGWRAA